MILVLRTLLSSLTTSGCWGQAPGSLQCRPKLGRVRLVLGGLDHFVALINILGGRVDQMQGYFRKHVSGFGQCWEGLPTW